MIFHAKAGKGGIMHILAQRIRISNILPGSEILYYPCKFTQAFTRGVLIGCFEAHAHGREVTSMFSQNDVTI